MGKPIDANGTQAILTWSQIDWQKVEKTVLRLQHRIFMAKVKGDVQGMESLQRLLASSRAAKLLAIRKVGQENSGRRSRLNFHRLPTLSAGIFLRSIHL